MIPNPLWPIRIVPTRRGRFACLACGLLMAGLWLRGLLRRAE